MAVAAFTMIVEILVGYATNSMALLADGWHMATHVAALGIASAAYVLARRYASHASFGFGTGKISALAGFTSGIALAMAAIAMLVESVRRLGAPGEIDFRTSIPVAILGLAVNVVSVILLGVGDAQPDAHAHVHEASGDDAQHAHDERQHDGHRHDVHDHTHEHHRHGHHGNSHEHHRHGHHDHNHRAVLLHVLADALTSALAIVALVVGYLTGATWLDAMIGVAGSLVILHWVGSLARATTRELLDLDPDGGLQNLVREHIERLDDVHVLDLHVWSLGGGRHGCVVTLASSAPRETSAYRQCVLGAAKSISHVTVEVRHRDSLAPLRVA